MPRKIISQLLLLTLIAVSAVQFQARAAASIIIDSPRGGEMFYIGQTQPLRIRSKFKTLRIELSRDGGATFEPLGDLVNLPKGPRDTFVWNVSGPGTFNGIIRATRTLRQNEISVTSAPFSVAEPAGRVGPGTPPAGGVGTYARANISIDADGRVLTASDGNPVNLGSEVTGLLPTARIADAAVITPKVAPRAVTADRINGDPASSGFVLTADGNGGADWVPNDSGPGAGSITTEMLADGSVTKSKLADGAVNLATKISGTLADSSLSTNVALLNGRAGGQTLNGGTGASESLTLSSTSNATKGSIVLNPNGGNVGIGTASPGQKLSVAGTIESTTGGFRFPDSSTQSTAVIGVPSGDSILSASSVAPPGYTYTGSTLQGPGSEAWNGRAPMPVAKASFGLASVNGRLYVIGGLVASGFSNSVEEYDPGSNSWRARANMPTARDWLGVAVASGRIYTFGGYNGTTYLNVTEIYDPATDTWSSGAPMPTARSGQSCATVNGLIYVMGGDLGGVTELTTNEEYNPATDTWHARAGMPTARTAAGTAVVNNQIHYIGGSSADNSRIFAVNEVYDPASDSWGSRAPMPAARHNFGTALNGLIYIVGGSDSAGALNTVLAYDPGSNSWLQKASLAQNEQYMQAAAVNGRLFAMGGFTGGYQNVNQEYINTTSVFYVHRRN